MVRLFASPGAAAMVVKKHPCLPRRSNRIPKGTLKSFLDATGRSAPAGINPCSGVANQVVDKEMRQAIVDCHSLYGCWNEIVNPDQIGPLQLCQRHLGMVNKLFP